MATIEERTGSGLQTTWTAPNLVMRAMVDDSVRTNRSSDMTAGKIRPELIPIEYEEGPLPEGGSLTFFDPERYWLQGGVSEEELEDFVPMIFTLEERLHLTNRAIQAVRFRGRVSADGGDFSEDANNEMFTLSDAMLFEDAPIVLDASGKTIGEIAQIIEDGYQQSLKVDAGRMILKTVYFPQYPLPTDRDGTPIGGFADEIKNSTIRPGNLVFEGGPLSAAFARMVEKMGTDLIPTIEYDGAFAVLTARQLGHTERDLIVGQDGVADPQHEIRPNVKSIQGQRHYRDLYNRIYAEGGEGRRAEPQVLTQDWTEAEAAAVLADGNLQEHPSYRHVGRRYRLDNEVWAIAPTAEPRGGPGAGLTTSRDDVRFWQRMSTTQTIAGDDWQPIYPNFKWIFERGDGNTEGFSIDRSKRTPKYRKAVAIEFDEPQEGEYLTDAQTASLAAETPIEEGTRFYYEYEIEAIQIGPRLLIDTGVVGDYARMRTRYFRNEEARWDTHVKHYTPSPSSGGARTEVENSTDWGRDDRVYFNTQVQALLNESKNPTMSTRVTLWYYDPTWKIGTRIKRILDSARNVLRDNLPYYVHRVRHDLVNMRTELELSPLSRFVRGGR